MDELPSGLPEFVADDEPLARFITTDAHLNAAGAKPSAFMPQPGRVRVSVFRHGEQPAEPLWHIAAAHVESAGRRVRAVAIVPTREVRDAHMRAETLGATALPSLDVEADDEPPRHADIVGWALAGVDSVSEKAVNKALARAFVRSAKSIRK